MTKGESILFSSLSRIEHDTWLELVAALKEAEKSGNAFPLTEAAGHPATGCTCAGCRAFVLVRAWGKAYAEVKIMEASLAKKQEKRDIKRGRKPMTLMELFAQDSAQSCPGE